MDQAARMQGGQRRGEFDPGRDLRDQSLSTLIWLMEWLLLRLYE